MDLDTRGSASFRLLGHSSTQSAFLDLGIGRALTRFLAVHDERDPDREATIVWTALAAIFALGMLGGSLVWAFANPLASSFAHGDASLQRETASAIRVLSVSVPLVVLSSGLRGILEAFCRFDLTNRVSIPISLLNLIVPFALVRFAAQLPLILSLLVFLRLAAVLLFVRAVMEVVPAMRRPRFSVAGIRPVIAFGGWVTVSNATGPLFAQAERFLLGSSVTLAAVAFIQLLRTSCRGSPSYQLRAACATHSCNAGRNSSRSSGPARRS